LLLNPPNPPNPENPGVAEVLKVEVTEGDWADTDPTTAAMRVENFMLFKSNS